MGFCLSELCGTANDVLWEYFISTACDNSTSSDVRLKNHIDFYLVWYVT